MNDLLNNINGPEDIKTLSPEDLSVLAQNIRDRIIEVTSEHGGHLSSSLGVVDLTIALHYVFNSPTDKIVWDVGHQVYAHKLLTGRKDRFDTLRQFNGISGFPRPDESEHDAFISGHSSTSVSLALGMATARDLQEGDENVIAVIGDGALSGGMAFEALNNAGLSGKDLMVVLNANDMSISPSVGAFSKYLNNIITNPLYNRIKHDIEELVEKIPRIGHLMVETAHKMEEGVKGLFVPGVIFEEMGFRYFGPLDGHDIPLLLRTLNFLKDVEGPKILHVITKKGKGYPPAEHSPDLFHSAPPFNIETGEPVVKSKPEKTYTQAFSDIMLSLGREDKRVIAITAAMMQGTGLYEFAQLYPDRFFDVGIAEQHAITFAGGVAARGLRPIVAVYSTFLQRGYDQILHDICIGNYPVIFAIDRAGLVGPDGPTHHGVFDISFLSPIPNMVIMEPSSEEEMATMFELALKHNGPSAIRYPKGSITYQEKGPYKPAGFKKGRVLTEGEDILVLALGSMLKMGMDVTKLCQKEQINACLLDPRFIKPLDEELILAELKKIKKCVIIEDHALSGGFGHAVVSLLNKNNLSDVECRCFGYPDIFIQHGAKDLLLDKYGISPQKILETIKTLVAAR